MMSRQCEGFTMAEFAVGVLILAIAAGLAIPGFGCFGPNFAPYGIKAKEAEVKSNIHSIQIALERYAVDTGGIYPAFLIGAEADYNVIRAQYEPQYDFYAKIASGPTPFALSRNAPVSQQNCLITMDPLIQFAYLAEYPENPFAKRDAGMWNASLTTGSGRGGLFPYGGLHGDKMFDLGFGWGDTPQTDYILTTDESLDEKQDTGAVDSRIIADPDLDAPGNFYYHPIFADMLPVYVHYLADFNDVHGPDTQPGGILKSYGITSDEVIGYHLYGYGWSGNRNSNIKRGLDVFNRMPAASHGSNGKFANIDKIGLPDVGLTNHLDSVAIGSGGQKRVEATGYPSSEFDPWTYAFAEGIDPANPSEKQSISGPDGIKDWVIIEVTSFVNRSRYDKYESEGNLS